MNREILRLALPSIVQNITVPLLGLCDVAIMGHIGNASYIGAIAVGSMIFNVMYWLCGFLRMGTSGLTAQAFGSGSGMFAVLRSSLRLGLSIGVLLVVLQVPLRHLSFWLMQPTADVASLCLPYYNICIWGAPAVLGLYALTGWFIGMQDTRTPMVVAIAQNLINIAVSATLVFFFGMGVEGVATGTLVAQWSGLLLSAVFVGFRYCQVCSAKADEALSLTHFLAVNRDIFLRTLCLVAVNLYFTSAGAAQGALLLAVNTLLMQLFTLFSYFMDGFAYAGEALAGRYFGASDRLRLQRVVRLLFGWGALVVVVFTVLYWLCGPWFLRLLTTDPQVLLAATPYLPWVLLIPLSGVAAFVWDGVFIGTTYTRGMLFSCVLASAVFFALWFLLSAQLGNHALWLSLIAYLALRGIAQTLLWPRFIAKKCSFSFAC